MFNIESLTAKFLSPIRPVARGSEALYAEQRNKAYHPEQILSSLLTYRPTPPQQNWLLQSLKPGTNFILLPALNQVHAKGQNLAYLATIYIAVCLVFVFTSLVQRCKQVDVGQIGQQTFNEGNKMTTFFEERLSKDFISEKLEGQLDEIKQQLEENSRCETINSILAEELCKAKQLLEKKDFTERDMITLGEILERISSSISKFASRHKKDISEKNFRELSLNAYIFKVSGKLCQAAVLSLAPLKPNDSLKNLKRWSQVLEAYAEFLDECRMENLPSKMKLNLKDFCVIALKLTTQIYPENPRKEKCRRLIRDSASFILQWIDKHSQREVEKFAVGSLPSAKLLEETKNRLPLLDLLNPSNNEEAKEQRETRQYLLEVLND
jgi:hypothetical protein